MMIDKWKARLIDWRHIAYRARVKYYYGSRAYGWLRDRLWPIATDADGLQEIYRHEVPLFDGFREDAIGDEFARRSFAAESLKWSVHPDQILEARGDILIEPGHSLAMIDRRHFIEATRGSAHKIMTPPFAAKWRGPPASTRRVPSLIHFDGFLGTNLYHFVADALNPYLMMQATGMVDMAQPVLIHRQVHDVPFVRELLRLPCFDGVDWLVQEFGEFISTRKMFKAVASYAQFHKSYELLASTVEKRPLLRIFLDRGRLVGRRLTNMHQIAPILACHGFETVCAEDLTYPEQAALFAQASHLVGLHGAGLTNLLFCDAPNTRVLELTSRGLMNPHFYWMCNVLGFEYYDVMAGTHFDSNLNYAIDAGQFEERLAALIAS